MIATAALPFAAVRVIRASRLLEPADKLLWGELHTFDAASRKKGEVGAYIGARALAARLGATEHAIEHGRRRMVALGLLESDGGRGRRGARYYPVLPLGCIPTNDRPAPEMLARCVAVLDAHIEALRRNGADRSAIQAMATTEGKAQRVGAILRRLGPFPEAPDEVEYVTVDQLDRQRGMAHEPQSAAPNNGAQRGGNGADGAPHIKESEVLEAGGKLEGASAPSSPSAIAQACSLSPPSSPDVGAGKDCAHAQGDAGANNKAAAQGQRRAADLERLSNYRAQLETEGNAAKRRLLEHSIRQVERRLEAAA